MNLRRMTFGFGLLGTLAVAACGDDDTTPTPGGDTDAPMTSEGGGKEASTTPEAGAGETSTTPEGGGGEAGPLTGAALVERGNYIVNHVAACGDCHTPRTAMGALDETKHLAGSQIPFADLVPDTADGGAGVGKVYVRNLTPDMATGLGSWTDAEIKSAILDGNAKGVDGGTRPLFPIMPYFVLHNMSAEDANAIVAYLRSIPAVANAIPDREPLPFPLPAAAPPVPAASIPNSTLTADAGDAYASAQRGKYLAGNIGICMECHTEHNMGVPVLKETALFGGNNAFATADIGLPPVYGATIYSANITPDDTGIKGWVAADVAQVLSTGTDKKGRALCPPMPFGPMGAFGGLTDKDKLDIGNYITSLPPVANAAIPFCIDPFRTPAPDAGGDGAPE